MSRLREDRDVLQAVRLLESLRSDPFPLDWNVEAAVSRRVRLLPVPRAFTPIVSLGQFGWAAAAALFTAVLGGAGLAALLGTGALGASSSLRLAVGRIGAVLFGAVTSFARSVLQILLGAVTSLLGDSVRLDTLLGLATRGAIVVCTVMMFLTLVVVLHETRTRRITG